MSRAESVDSLTLEGRDVDVMTGDVGDVEWTSTFAEFIDANSDVVGCGEEKVDDDVLRIRGLGIGESVDICWGHGVCRVARVS